MLLGYNTNGLAHHDPLQAIELLGNIGYKSVALTLDHGLLNPFSDGLNVAIEKMIATLDRFGMRNVIETGARFLLDPQEKHEPTLLSVDANRRAVRIDFLKRAIDIAHRMGSDCVSLWSGCLREDMSQEQAMERLVDGLRPVVEHAAEQGVVIGFEPEPGMFIDTMERYEQLLLRLDAQHSKLTLDLGHLHCQGELPISDYIQRWGDRIVNVHIEDMRGRVHEHLMFGEGEMDFPPIIDALEQVGYQGALHVELSRHSHEGPTAARRAFEFLSPLMLGL